MRMKIFLLAACGVAGTMTCSQEQKQQQPVDFLPFLHSVLSPTFLPSLISSLPSQLPLAMVVDVDSGLFALTLF